MGSELDLAEAALGTRPFRWRMGLRSLEPEDWLERRDDEAEMLAAKEELLAHRRDEVMVSCPGSEIAAGEAVEAIRAWLEGVSHEAVALGTGAHPLEQAARLVTEDLCLMERVDGEWVLTAAVVCFPTDWDVRSKLGRSLRAIHDPVPLYHEQVGASVDRYFDRMRVDRPVWRINWGIATTGGLRVDGGRGGTMSATGGPRPAELGESHWLRAERQTLRRFPRHDAVLFTIGVHRWRFDEVVRRPGLAARLAASLASLPEPIAGYKNAIGPDRDRLVEYLVRARGGP